MLQDKFLKLEDEMNDSLIERGPEIHSAVLAILSRRHMFMVGAPGIAKSMLVTKLVSLISGLDRETCFKWLLTKHTTPEELYGPPDFTLMRNEGIYKRVTSKKLPEAQFAFLDEIFKANSAILNTLLTIINEGEFENHNDDPSVPLQTLFAASNEIPTTAELEALADRLHFWHHVEPIKESANFVKMLEGVKRTDDPVLSLEDIAAAQREVDEVVITDLIYEVLVDLRSTMSDEGIVVSDRRFQQSLAIIRAEAWLGGRDTAGVEDCKPLQHVMWRDIEQIPKVRKAVLDLVDPLERDILAVLTELDSMYTQFERDLADADSNTVKARLAIEAYQTWRKAQDDWRELKKKEEASPITHKSLDRLRSRIKELGPALLEKGVVFGTDTKSLEDGND